MRPASLLAAMRRSRADVFVAGALGIALLTATILFFLGHPQNRALLILLAVELPAGREASIPAGLAAGLEWHTAAVAVNLIELTILFLLFPLLVALATGLHKVGWLESTLARAQAYAKRNPDVDVLALGALTFMPFLPVGALTSVLIGELLRLPSKYLLPTLAVSLVIANVLMAYATDRLLAFFPDPRLVAAIMTLLLLGGAGIAWLVHRVKSRRRREAPRIP